MITTVRSADTTAQVEALRAGCGTSPLSGGWIAVTGDDRVRWLNGMVTNSVQALAPGEGAYSFFLSAQGRIQGDATVWAEKDRLLLQTSAEQVAPLLTMLDRFIIMDDVELQDSSGNMHGLLIVGPETAEKLQMLGVQARTSKLLKRQDVPWHDGFLTLLNAYSPLVPRIEAWSENPLEIAALKSALEQAGAIPCDEAALELLRLSEGTPRFGTDIRDRDLPQETSQTRALHFNKGCYLGQEIVERIRSRGNVHRTFTGFVLQGETPTPGSPLLADGKQVGELTSIAGSDLDSARLALGFIRREALERGLSLTYPGGNAEPRALATAS